MAFEQAAPVPAEAAGDLLEDELDAEAYILGSHLPGVANLVVSPDGSLSVGIDPARAPKEEPPRPVARRTNNAAQEALRRVEAQQYLTATVNKRRILFLVLLTVDFFYFLALLIYQVIKRRQGDLPAQQSGITGDGDQPVAVWIGTTDLRIELVVFSLVVDFVGWVAAVQPRTPPLSIFCVLQALDTVILSLRAATLFILWRVVQLIFAAYLRTAIHTYQTMQPFADDDRAEGMYLSGREVWGITQGFFAILAGRDAITPEDRERRRQRQTAARARAAATVAAQATDAAAARVSGPGVGLGDIELGMNVGTVGAGPSGLQGQRQPGMSLGGAAWGVSSGRSARQGSPSAPSRSIFSLSALFPTRQVRPHEPPASQGSALVQPDMPHVQMNLGMGGLGGFADGFQLRMDPSTVRWVPLVIPGANTPRSAMARSAAQAASMQMHAAATVAQAASILSTTQLSTAATATTITPHTGSLLSVLQPQTQQSNSGNRAVSVPSAIGPAAHNTAATAAPVTSAPQTAVDGPSTAAADAVLLQAAMLAVLRDMRELRDRRRRERVSADGTPVPHTLQLSEQHAEEPGPVHPDISLSGADTSGAQADPKAVSHAGAAISQGGSSSGAGPTSSEAAPAESQVLCGEDCSAAGDSFLKKAASAPAPSTAGGRGARALLQPIRTKHSAVLGTMEMLRQGVSPRGMHGPTSPQYPLLPHRQQSGSIGPQRVSPRYMAMRTQLAADSKQTNGAGPSIPCVRSTATDTAPAAASCPAGNSSNGGKIRDNKAAARTSPDVKSEAALRLRLRLLLASTVEEMRALKEQRRAKDPPQGHAAGCGIAAGAGSAAAEVAADEGMQRQQQQQQQQKPPSEPGPLRSPEASDQVQLNMPPAGSTDTAPSPQVAAAAQPVADTAECEPGPSEHSAKSTGQDLNQPRTSHPGRGSALEPLQQGAPSTGLESSEPHVSTGTRSTQPRLSARGGGASGKVAPEPLAAGETEAALLAAEEAARLADLLLAELLASSNS